MANSNIKNHKCHEYIVKRVKEILTDSYSYSYSLVLFDVLKIKTFDDIFDKLVSDYELSDTNLNNFNKLVEKYTKSKNTINSKELNEYIKKKRKLFVEDKNSKTKKLNDLVKLFAKMSIGFSFAHPIEIADKEKDNYSVIQNYSNYIIKKDNLEISNLDKATTSDIKRETKDLIARIYKDSGDSFDSKNKLKEVLKADNFENKNHYRGILKDILKVIEVIVNKNRNYYVFSQLSSDNKYHLDTEHIIPRNYNKKDNDKEKSKKNKKLCKWKLGNASLLESFINQPMGNAGFICKCNGCYSSDQNDNDNTNKIHNFRKSNVCYRDSSIRMTRDLLKYNRFSNDEIIDRTDELADVIVEIVFGDKFDGDCKKS